MTIVIGKTMVTLMMTDMKKTELEEKMTEVAMTDM